MSKLNPPILSPTIDAFTDQGLIIPFEINKTVSIQDIEQCVVHIEDLYGLVISIALDKISLDLTNKIIVINDTKNFQSGQYYKIQIAFVNKNNEVGFFSATALTKYTKEPTIFIQEYEAKSQNNYLSSLTAIYQPEDTEEKLYSSYYIIMDFSREIVYSSPVKIHNFSQDGSLNYQQETINLSNVPLQANQTYLVQFITTSQNGLQRESPIYRFWRHMTDFISNGFSIEQDKFIASRDDQTGFVRLELIKEENANVRGNYLISRLNLSTNEILDIGLEYIILNGRGHSWVFYDKTAEQGEQYQYSVVLKQGLLYSKPFWSNIVLSDFEDILLIDADFSLKIRYNGNIKTMKNILQESKIDTLGGQYPYFFRNGNLKYKEFSLEGLIYYEENDDDNVRHQTVSSSAKETTIFSSTLDVKNQRDYKLKILEWLNNGKDKLLKTPQEGAYFVRLLNVSLNPDMVSGRKYHSFSATAYESCPVITEELINHGLISLEQTAQSVLSIGSWALSNLEANKEIVLNDGYYVSNLECFNLEPGTIITLTTKDGLKTQISVQNNGTIGLQNEAYIVSVNLANSQKKGTINFCYNTINQDNDLITKQMINYQLDQVITFQNYTQFQTFKEKYLDSSNNKIQIMDLIEVSLEKQSVNSLSQQNFYQISINGNLYDLTNLVTSSKYQIDAKNDLDFLNFSPESWGEGVQVTIQFTSYEIIEKQ